MSPQIQIGKYKRPGIFLEEYDNSIIQTPIVEGLATLVIGVSKKGPINTPVVVKSQTDLDAIFGPLDRQLEKKGSFFHRTISKMLQSSQVIAINLLKTDDILDKIEYKSLSTSTGYTNGVIYEDSYRRFFDTSGFWKRDVESFLNVVKDDLNANQKILNLTNMGDKPITVFVFKTSRTGFDVNLLSWYGTPELIPSYLYPTDFVSDYMLDVVVVAGDWTNYTSLSVDNKWGTYFDTTGLRKTKVNDFVNDRNVTILKYYQGVSLIPFFRDQNGANIFIETVINRDTNLTGLFCAFDIESLETDYPNGLIDIIGNNLIDTDSVSSIDFLSYNDTIIERKTYEQVVLDKPGNTIAILGSASINTRSGSTNRTAYYAEGYVNGLKHVAPVVASASITLAFAYDNAAPLADPYSVVGGVYITFSPTASFTINPAGYISSTSSIFTYSSTLVLDTTGTIKKLDNTNDSTLLNVSATDIVLGYSTFGIQKIGNTASIMSNTYTPVTVTTTGYVELTVGSSASDITISASGSELTYNFNTTSNSPDTSSYKQYRRFKEFNYLTSNLSSVNKNEMTAIINFNSTKDKVTLEDMTVSNIVTSTILDKSFTLDTGLTGSNLTDLSTGNVLFFIKDDEFVLGSDLVTTKNTVATSTDGVVARYSDFYAGYYNGVFNTKDYFYDDLITSTYTIQFLDVTSGAYIGDYIIFQGTNPGLSAGMSIIVPDSTLNTSVLVINNDSSTLAADLGFVGSYYAFGLVNDVTDEIVSDVTKVFDASNKHYLENTLDETTGDVTIRFMDSSLTSINPKTSITTSLDIYTQLSNYRQTVEIEEPTGYVTSPNKILMDATRFTEIKVGDFLEAYVDPSALGTPKKLTRILSKKLYAADTRFVEVLCDAEILKYTYGTDKQTFRFTSVNDYVNTYKGINLSGFTIRTASLPDGTETRQSTILNVIGKGTALFEAITNKEAISMRYLIDSFGLGLTELSKQQLVDICGERLDVLGILNMPSIRSFRNSTSPTFVDSEGTLKVEYISKGGDPESSPAFLYSFGEGRGASCVGYFTPYTIVNDGGRPLECPPSSFVATSYMKKHILQRTNVVPWTVVAGITNGLVTGIAGLEFDYKPTDIEFLNTMGANAIVTKKNRGFAIEMENTAQRDVKSALSFLHVREVLIELEGELIQMLKEFQWKFNTPDVRAEIKLRADIICERYVARSGIYTFFVKCDEENNTPDIIDNQVGVIDVYIEPVKAMSVIVLNTTIMRTGGVSSAGFA